ncbi:MAG: ABC transporter ATP-binding protein [Candidatus Pelagibacterales bacterium]|nr:MAG: ABC transporter ATP-binding protein [Pelagibacterales bacterium]
MTAKEILLRLYNDYTKKYLKKIIISLLLSIIVAASTSSIAWLLDPAIKKIFLEKDDTLIYLIPLAIILAFVAKGVSLYLAKKIMIRVSGELTAEVQLDLFKSILKSDTKKLENKHSGKYLSHLTYDVGMLTNLLSVGLLNIMKDSFTLICLLFVMFYQNLNLSLFAIIMIPLASYAAKSLGKRIGKVVTQAQEVSGIVTSYLTEILKNYKIVKVYQKESFEVNRASKYISDMKEKGIKIAVVMVRASPIMETLTGIMIAGLIYYSAKLVGQGTLEVNNFFSFLAAMMLAYQPVRSLATLNLTISQGLSGARRILPIIDQQHEIFENKDLKKLSVDKGTISFKDVDFSYEETNEKVLHGVNLKINGGETVALVGHSGAGKSTIMNLIPRFYDPKKGNISIDDQLISNTSLNSLRSQISMVNQETILFDDTIEANVAYAKDDCSKEQIIQACKYSHAHEFIDKLPNKYNTLIGENGTRLSGGEKQRLSIARAILKNTPIILLDEATSSLDADTEEKIQDAIMYLTKNRTTLIIAHRLSTIFKANRIFVIDKGKVAAEGNHKELLEKSEIYKNFYNKQLKNF